MRAHSLVFLFAVPVSVAAWAGCDSRPAAPIEDEPDARVDVVPATPEAGPAEDAGAADAHDDVADVMDASDADASASEDADAS
jgi:hypothetical protein